jgi:hypothetical protein
VRPDLSGTWTLVPITAGASDPGGAQLGRTVKIRQTDTDLTMSMNGNFSDSELTRTYRITGTTQETINTNGSKETRVETSTLKLTEKSLVITTNWTFHEKVTTLTLTGPNQMSVTAVTKVLTTRGGEMTMGTIAPPTRIYRRDPK